MEGPLARRVALAFIPAGVITFSLGLAVSLYFDLKEDRPGGSDVDKQYTFQVFTGAAIAIAGVLLALVGAILWARLGTRPDRPFKTLFAHAALFAAGGLLVGAAAAFAFVAFQPT